MAKAFASQGDTAEKTISFIEVGEGLWAFTAEGDPNSGVIIGDDRVMVIEASDSSDRPIARFVLTARPPTVDRIEEFRRRHPELADALVPAIRAMNYLL